MTIDWAKHNEKIRQAKAVAKRKLKYYWPYFRACDTCKALEGNPCWNMNDVKAKLAPRDQRYWQTITVAHTGRYKMNKEEYQTRREELHKLAVEKHNKDVEDVKRTAMRYGIYL